MEITTNPESVGLCSKRLASIGPWMKNYLDAGKLAGTTAMVSRHGQVAYCESMGYQDIESRRPWTTDTILRFYSMTKPVTAVAVLMLYEQGCFQLDNPVADFIPSFKDMNVYVSGTKKDMVIEPVTRPMTIHHLLTHTSGLTYGGLNEGIIPELCIENRVEFKPNEGPLADVVDRLAQIPLEFQPGSRWNYGVSFDVLGRLVEVISGLPLDRFMEEKIFKPLNMKDTAFAVPKEKIHRFASLYERTGNSALALRENPENSPMIDSVETLAGGAGLVSTLADYFRFTEMLRRKGELDGKRLLSRKTVDYMTRNHLPGDLADMGQPAFNETTFEGIGFGLGVSVMLDPAKAQVIGTPGEYAWGGYASTAFWIDPVEDMIVLFLTQLIPSSAYPIRRELRVLTYQALIN